MGSPSGTSPRGRRGLSVRARVLASVVTMSALGLAVAGGVAFVVQARSIDTQVNEALLQEVEEFRTLAADGLDPETGEPFRSIEQLLRVALQRNVPHDNETYLTFLQGVPFEYDRGERPVRLEAEPAVLAEVAALAAASDVAVREVDTAAGRVRLAVVPVGIDGAPDAGAYVIAVALDRERAGLFDLARLYAAVALGSLLLLTVVGWLVAGRLLRPLRDLRESARRITDTDLTERLPVAGNDDVSDLTRTYNDMLDRLEVAFDVQRGFLDDAGHELRTPVTILRGHLELLDPGDPEEVAETRALLLDEVDRMARQVEDLILLAKSQRPDFLRIARVHLGDLADEVLAKAAGLTDRDWLIEERADAWVLADGQRLTQALLQLADNAAKYSPPGSPISIGTRAVGGAAQLWVRDEGIGIDLADQQRIFDRFHRAPGAAIAEGRGLGLAIVSAIATAHGGSVRVESEPGRGATFRLVIPRVEAADPRDSPPRAESDRHHPGRGRRADDHAAVSAGRRDP